MSVFTRHLKAEHMKILETLDLLKYFHDQLDSDQDIDIGDLRSLVFLLQGLVEDVHHAKEERFLFPALEASGKIGSGGPRCTYFMGMRLLDNLPERILSSEEAKGFRTDCAHSASPLSIPLEEHEAGHISLLWMRMEIDNFQNTVSQRRILSALIMDYDRLLRLHILKEDTCLFALADSVLDEATQARLLKQAQDSISEARIEKYNDILQKLKSAAKKLPA